MRTTLLSLAILFIVPHVDAAPVPDPGRFPKQKLDELKKRLPDVLKDFVKSKAVKWLGNSWDWQFEVRVFRRVGAERAKAVIMFQASDAQKKRQPTHDVLLTVFLSYQDGCWTTERFESASFFVDERMLRTTFGFLMLAIDEAAEK